MRNECRVDDVHVVVSVFVVFFSFRCLLNVVKYLF